MIKWVFIGLLILLVGCESGVEEEFVNETNETVEVVEDENISVDSVSDLDLAKQKYENKRLKKLEALGFGIFNYSILTLSTCDFYYYDFSDKIIDLKDDIKNADDEVEEEREDVEELEEELDDIIDSGNEKAINDLKEDIEGEQDELEFAEEELEDLEKLLKKHEIIHAQIKDYCRELEVFE